MFRMVLKKLGSLAPTARRFPNDLRVWQSRADGSCVGGVVVNPEPRVVRIEPGRVERIHDGVDLSRHFQIEIEDHPTFGFEHDLRGRWDSFARKLWTEPGARIVLFELRHGERRDRANAVGGAVDCGVVHQHADAVGRELRVDLDDRDVVTDGVPDRRHGVVGRAAKKSAAMADDADFAQHAMRQRSCWRARDICAGRVRAAERFDFVHPHGAIDEIKTAEITTRGFVIVVSEQQKSALK